MFIFKTEMKTSKIKTVASKFGMAIAGYIIMAGLITLWQSGVFHETISYHGSSRSVLYIGGLGTVLSAVIAGWVAGRAFNFTSDLPHIIMSVLVVIESTYLTLADKTGDPLWFDILAALSLIIGIFFGFWVGLKLNHKFASANIEK